MRMRQLSILEANSSKLWVTILEQLTQAIEEFKLYLWRSISNN
jgi:hypothetical protein